MPVFACNTSMNNHDANIFEESKGRSKSGKTRMSKLTPEERKSLATQAARARWKVSDVDVPGALGDERLGH